MAENGRKKLRVGYGMSEKKYKAIDFDRVKNLALERGYTCENVGLNNPVMPKDGVDVIVTKLTDALAAKEKPENKELIHNWKKFEEKYPHVVYIDEVATQDIVTDRINTCEKLDTLHKEFNHNYTGQNKPLQAAVWGIVPAEIPLSVSSLSSLGVEFPVMCKTINACGSSASHHMGLVCNEEGLKEFSSPVFVQEYYNHDAVIFKIFVVGPEYHIQPRTSLANVDLTNLPTTPPYIFNSQGINKNITPSSSSPSTVPSLSPRHLSAIPEFINLVKKHFGMTLFGFDVIIHNNNGRKRKGEEEKDEDDSVMSVIDLNFFPGYLGMEKFPAAFLDLAESLVKEKKEEKENT